MLSVSKDKTQFGAYYVSSSKIKGKIRGRWHDVNVNLVKFETNLHSDLRNIEAVSYLWGGKNLSKSIANEALTQGGGAHIYGLTYQTDSFDKIDPSKIIGLMSTQNFCKGAKETEIFKIGTNPKYAYEQNRKVRDVKHIAKAMIEAFSEYADRFGVKPVVSFIDSPNEAKFLNKVGLVPKTETLVEGL